MTDWKRNATSFEYCITPNYLSRAKVVCTNFYMPVCQSVHAQPSLSCQQTGVVVGKGDGSSDSGTDCWPACQHCHVGMELSKRDSLSISETTTHIISDPYHPREREQTVAYCKLVLVFRFTSLVTAMLAHLVFMLRDVCICAFRWAAFILVWMFQMRERGITCQEIPQACVVLTFFF